MSTATPPPSNLQRDNERIRSPLAKLRKFINSYVGLEGLTVLGLFVALWFWVGMVLDYGAFKLFLLDWVQWLPKWFRASVLGTVVLALVVLLVLTVLVRLLVHFSDAALALVLERRFPDKLGDRLITAVELSDPKQVEAIGYSPALVRETIREAAARVDEVPVKEVFDWRRLVMRGLACLVLTLGLYAVVGGIFCAVRAVQGDGAVLTGYGELNDVSRIWFERNVLLRNTIWPRRAYLEVVDFPDDLRIAQNTAPPALRVRAWKYVLADGDAREGWRLLRWEDLTARPGLVGVESVPALPGEWKPRESYGVTVDEVEQALSNFTVRMSRPDGGELPGKYNVPTNSSDDPYRLLMWSELTPDKVGGLAVPGLPPLWDAKAGPAVAAGVTGMLPGGAGALAAAGQLVAPGKTSLSVDQVAAKLAEAEGQPKPLPVLKEIRKVIDRLELLAKVQGVVDAVEAKAGDRANRRTLRKLVVPGEVTLTYKGRSATNTSSLTPVAGNEFTGNFSELKETVTFRVRGEDYETPQQTIIVVERPRVERIESIEERPAYLYYRENGELTSTFLRDQRQPLEPASLQTSSDLTNFDVPTGTHVTLTLTISKPLNAGKVKVIPDGQFAHLYVGEAVQVPESHKITLRLPNLRREQRFTVQYHDEDDVPGERKFIIQPREDTAPRIRELQPDEVVGKGKEGFAVTALARVPFRGRVVDDRGLAKVRFACRVIPADFLTEQKVRSLLLTGAVPLAASGFGAQLQSVAYTLALTKELGAIASDEGGIEQFIEVPAFGREMRRSRPAENDLEVLTPAEVRARLATRKKEPYRQLFKDFAMTPDPWTQKLTENEDDEAIVGKWIKAGDIDPPLPGREPRAPLLCDLPFWKLRYKDRDGREKPIKAPDDQPQRRFVVEVRLVVEDNYATGEVDANKRPIPHITSSDTFTFVVVPENELRGRIAGEEDQRYRDLVKTVKPIADAVDRAREMYLYMSGGDLKAAEVNNFRARTVDMIDGVQGAHQEAKVVYQAYDRILKELRINQVSTTELHRVYGSIYKPLQEASLRQFDQAINEVKGLKNTLDDETRPVANRVKDGQGKAKDARDRLMDLQKTINSILAAMEGLSRLNELVAELARIEREVEEEEAKARGIYRLLFTGQFGKEKDKDEKEKD